MVLGDIMTQRVVTVELDDRLEAVKEIFENLHFHHVLVVEEGHLFGVLSDRDLLKALSPHIGTASETPRDRATLSKPVHQVMTRKPFTLPKATPVGEAATLLLQNKVSCIPVVDDDGKPIGIVTWRDLLKALATPRSP